MEIRLNVSHAYLNKELKPGFNNSAKSYSFKRSTVCLEALAAHIAAGGAFTPAYFSEDRRKGSLWTSAQIIGVDIDSKKNIQPPADIIAAMPFVRDYAWLVYPTASSTTERPKTRIVFVLDQVVTTPAAWQAIIRGVLSHLKHLEPDISCTDLPRYFAGSTQPGHITIGQVLPLAIAGGLTADEARADYQAYQLDLLRQQEPPQRKASVTTDEAERRTTNYVNKTIGTLETTTDGRHAALIKAAASLGDLVKGDDWTLTTDEAERLLMDACRVNGYMAKVGESEVQRVITDGMALAKGKPLVIRPKTHQINTKSTPAPQPHDEATQNADLGRLSAIKADLVVHTRYMSDIADKLPKKGVVVVISATATGKSTLNKKLSEGKSTLVIAPLTSLVNNAANAQEIENYKSVPHEYRHQAPRLAICLPSLKGYSTLSVNEFPQYDVLQLDEFSRNQEMLGSRDIFPGNSATIVMSVQEKLIKNTPLVMVTDAYLSQVEIDYLKALRPGEVFVVVNTYQRDYGKLVVYPEREQLQNAMSKAVKASQGTVVLVSTSKAEIERQQEFWAQECGADRVISIHGDNSTNKRQREFLRLISDSSSDAARDAANAEMKRYKVVLASPSLLTGFDVQPLVYRVFGNLFSNEIDAAGCMQLLHRYRNPGETHIWIEPKERNMATNAEAIYNTYRTKSDRTSQLVKINDEDNQPDFDGIIERHLKQQSAIEARCNTSLNNLYESFMALARPHYAIEMVDKDAPATNLNALKEASEAVKARQKELTLTVAPISIEMHQDRSERGIRTDEDNAALERWKIERLYRQPITEKLYNLYGGGEGATELYTFVDVLLKPESDLKAYDRNQIIDGVPYHLRDHRAMRSRTIKRVMLAIFGQRRNMTADYQLPAGEIVARFTTYATLHPDLLEDLSLYCGLSRVDAKREPLAIVKRVVRLMGLALRKEKYPSKDKSADEHHYALEADSLNLMHQLAQTRLDAIAAEKETTEHTASYKRPPVIIPDDVQQVSEAQIDFDALPSMFAKPSAPAAAGTGNSRFNPFSKTREVTAA